MEGSSQIMMDISNMEDIKKLKENKKIKYINLDIINPNLEVIYYFLEYGQNYSYAEKTADKDGYIYVSYDIFQQAELFILDIIKKIPVSLKEIEIARYLYIVIGKNIGYDINILPDKNETFNLKNISMINNIWGSILLGKGTNISLTRLFLYLCRFMKLDCKMMVTSKLGYLKNLLTIQNRNIIVDITQDIPYIQAGFKTKNFVGYDDNRELDKKIGYIDKDYHEVEIDQVLRNREYIEKDVFSIILKETSSIIPIANIKPIELSIIYKDIFEKYLPNQDVQIYNLYINSFPSKEHFILISYQNHYYSFNYTKNIFVEISENEMKQNIEERKIGIYLNEKIPFLSINKEILT